MDIFRKSFLIFYVLSAQIHLSFTYCELEEKYCFGKPHIACENHSFEPPANWHNFKNINMSSQLRSMILEILNEYRNRIALGKVPGFPKSSNMAILSWHYEFQQLMELSVAFVEHPKFACVATDTFKLPYESSYHVCGNYTPAEVIERAMVLFTKTELKSPDDRSFSEFYTARNFKIGCAMGTYQENSQTKNVFKCVTNKWGQKSLGEAYEQGDPCSNCEPRTQCTDFYGGLCVREKSGPVGLTGPPGPPGAPGLPGPSRACP